MQTSLQNTSTCQQSVSQHSTVNKQINVVSASFLFQITGLSGYDCQLIVTINSGYNQYFWMLQVLACATAQTT